MKGFSRPTLAGLAQFAVVVWATTAAAALGQDAVSQSGAASPSLTPLVNQALPGEQSLPTAPAMPGVAVPTPDQARQNVQQLLDFVAQRLPHQYDGDKDWGDTKKIWAGVRIRRDGLKLSTHRRWREVRHGLQTRYQIRFPGPADSPAPLAFDVRSVTPVLQLAPEIESPASPSSSAPNPPSGPITSATGLTGWLIECEAKTPLEFTARIERWNLGIQWYSIEVTGELTVRLRLRANLSSHLDYSEIPPAIVLDPVVEHASLHLDRFRVDRVSKVGGEVAEQWGEIAETVTKEIFLEDFNRKLPAKLNRTIDKHRDDLRWSFGL
ncbi:hypothetical protein FYK55_06030 [Roseiconus nitratireducens]|uniref:Secreted protein n=1 Tax=Roseiconus nitratireducens TaxID=2605748 RepID=A0A5M6DCD7_9BACT|nr:hypothetical protein [Roseiconus nitratireducens]KAA5545221.1 hypothetical protein FYK55_06030 [Roseiconus nitratireducens]